MGKMPTELSAISCLEHPKIIKKAIQRVVAILLEKMGKNLQIIFFEKALSRFLMLYFKGRA